VGSDFDLHEVSGLKLYGILRTGGEVAGNLVDGQAAGESNTSIELLGLLVREHLGELLLNEGIDLSANGGDIGSVDGKGDGFLESG